MAVLDRNRVSQLIELSAAERTAKGPERLVRENDVQQLLKAAWDDANQQAREGFLARVDKQMNNWPWSAVQAISVRGGGGGNIGQIVLPKPTLQTTPALLLLLMGQVDLPDVDPGNRIPDRGSPEGAAWEGLYRALDTWDTGTIKKWWSPTGWIPAGQATQGAPKDEGFDPAGRGGETPGPAAPAGSGTTPNSTPTAPTGTDLPAPVTESWTTRRVVVVAGVTFVVTGAAVMSYMSIARARELARYTDAVRAQGGR